MTRFSPFGALALCWFIGIVTHRVGIWFPIGFFAMIVVAVAQKRAGLRGDELAEPEQPS